MLDLDECALRPDLCENIEGAKCYNTEGSFECRCVNENHNIKDGKCEGGEVEPPQVDDGMFATSYH